MHLITLILALLLLSGCSETTTEPPAVVPAMTTIDPAPVAAAFGAASRQTSSELLNQVANFSARSRRFLDQPTEQNLNLLQASWMQMHLSYSQAMFGLIGSASHDPELLFRFDAWPIQAGFIDNLEHYPESGIVFDETLAITLPNLFTQHGITDNEEVILGLHALELLVFTRPLADFQPNQNVFNDRRRALLNLVTQQLETDSAQLVALAQTATQDLDPDVLLQLILTESLAKVRSILRESNLVAALDSGHCLEPLRSVQILHAELESMERFLVTDVPIAHLFKNADPVNYKNFEQTLSRGLTITNQASTSGEAEAFNPDAVAMAELPLVLSALTHQLEAFSQSTR